MIQRFLKLFTGFFLIALGIYLTRIARLGLNPWSTFHEGLSMVTGLSFGRVSQLTGLSIIMIALFLKIQPGLGTILNMYFCGFFMNIIEASGWLTSPSHIMVRWLALVSGIWVLAFGIYLYLSAELGAGPRDGLMIGLVKKTNFSVAKVRTSIEITVFIIGFILGGTVGPGTLVAAGLSGISVQSIFKIFNFKPKEVNHLTLKYFFKIFDRKFK